MTFRSWLTKTPLVNVREIDSDMLSKAYCMFHVFGSPIKNTISGETYEFYIEGDKRDNCDILKADWDMAIKQNKLRAYVSDNSGLDIDCLIKQTTC